MLLADRFYIPVSYVFAFKLLAVVIVIFLLPVPAQADNKSDISRFTSDREKHLTVDPSPKGVISLPDIEVRERGGDYRIKIKAVINAPADYVRYVLTDYSHLHRLNPSILESELLEQADDGVATVITRVNGCAAYFCQELKLVENVTMVSSDTIDAEMVPEPGQFKSGKTSWLIKDLGEQSELTYQSQLKPDIYIPPVVSKFLVKKAIKQEAQTCFTNLEKIASTLCSGVTGETPKPSVCE
jgi:hypothetical protein